jgi:hypothetical protein
VGFDGGAITSTVLTHLDYKILIWAFQCEGLNYTRSRLIQIWFQQKTFSLLHRKANVNFVAGLGSWCGFSSSYWGHLTQSYKFQKSNSGPTRAGSG